MSNFTPLTGAQLFQSMVEQYAVEAATPATTDAGSTLGSMFGAAVLLALQLQQQIVYLFAVSRLATSTGPDVDSFVEPFGIARIGTIGATGQVTFTYNSGSQTILVGSLVQTSGGVIFEVIADPSNVNYNVAANGYVASPTTSATVQCTQTGLLGNVLANTITLQYGGFPPIPGSPAITNPAAFTNGIATESDDALRTRFAEYISGGGEGTINSIVAAVQGYQAGLTVSFGDQVMSVYTMGNWVLTPQTPGWFTIVVNIAGQSGAPPTLLITELNALLLNNFRGAGIAYNVIPPTLIPVNGLGNVIVANGFTAATVLANVQAAFTSLVNNLGMQVYGSPSVLSLMATYVALAAVPGVQDITGLTLNGVAGDVQAPFGSQLVAGTVSGFTVG